MTTDVLIAVGTQISLADHAGDYTAPTATNEMEVGTPTAVNLDLGRPVATGAAESSANIDFGAARARRYAVNALIEMAVAPTTGTTFDFYFAPSEQATSINGNPGYVVGSSTDVSVAYDGTPGTLTEGLAQLLFIGSLVMSTDAVAQTGYIGTFSPPTRYGHLIVHNNNTGQSTVADGNEHCVTITPIIDQVA